MFKDWKNIILRGWSLMRIIRLSLAIFILVEALRNYDVMFGVIGFILLLQSVFNAGCCSNGACYTDSYSTDEDKTKEISFEEIKNK